MDFLLIMKTLGEPMRLKIFQQLLERKHCVRSLSKKLGITESAISQHLKIMRESGLIYGEKFGYHTHYLPKQEVLDLLVDNFQNMQKQSEKLNRNMAVCECEYRKENP